MIRFRLNGETVTTDAPADTPLLWVIREYFQLTGSKFGCGKGLCGACTMHMNGNAVRTCVLPVAAVADAEITTIEGLGQPDNLHIVQQAWVHHNVPQCGYCQPGQIMSASALLAQNPNPSDEDIDQFMSGNICRCGTYPRIKSAIKAAAKAQSSGVVLFDPNQPVSAAANAESNAMSGGAA
ncbi:(2Fe-2S)-binding protein [Pseudomaricurvus alkylphenolicus]|jgi:isoquinoline 1-oxidoreductase alpha subunit|uniref:(2Fe-2S)-binding protein n=1 Tax=Pseudomaricurvus alkylphenolicus TaxID=1306991 RepID=UPI00141E5E79|nr:(2Fe-2S)-binding protein [Pseudomaricurvus alkylphenolicus]NIB43976.1 (2Fe-2S)-binding protein [Pseudomaricurvus alkylphenolicus]